MVHLQVENFLYLNQRVMQIVVFDYLTCSNFFNKPEGMCVCVRVRACAGAGACACVIIVIGYA